MESHLTLKIASASLLALPVGGFSPLLITCSVENAIFVSGLFSVELQLSTFGLVMPLSGRLKNALPDRYLQAARYLLTFSLIDFLHLLGTSLVLFLRLSSELTPVFPALFLKCGYKY